MREKGLIPSQLKLGLGAGGDEGASFSSTIK